MAAAAALAAPAGCGGDDDAPEPVAQPDTYVPDPGATTTPERTRTSEEELECVRPGTTDAGDKPPSRGDPTTLVLRLRDLPERFSYAVGYQEGGVGRVPLTEVGDELMRAVEAADAKLSAARGAFGRGELPPGPVPPGAPPPPPSCPVPETEVSAAAVVASSPEGARLLYDQRLSLAGSIGGYGGSPIGARDRRTDPPVDVGEEAELLELESAIRGHTSRMIVWRDGRIVALVTVRGAGGDADTELLGDLAERQAEYVSAVR